MWHVGGDFFISSSSCLHGKCNILENRLVRYEPEVLEHSADAASILRHFASLELMNISGLKEYPAPSRLILGQDHLYQGRFSSTAVTYHRDEFFLLYMKSHVLE